MPIVVGHEQGLIDPALAMAYASGRGQFLQQQRQEAMQNQRLQMQLNARSQEQYNQQAFDASKAQWAAGQQTARDAQLHEYDMTRQQGTLENQSLLEMQRAQEQSQRDQAQSELEQKRWKEQWTTKNQAELDKLNDYEKKIRDDPKLQDWEKADVIRRIGAQRAGIRPELVPNVDPQGEEARQKFESDARKNIGPIPDPQNPKNPDGSPNYIMGMDGKPQLFNVDRSGTYKPVEMPADTIRKKQEAEDEKERERLQARRDAAAIHFSNQTVEGKGSDGKPTYGNMSPEEAIKKAERMIPDPKGLLKHKAEPTPTPTNPNITPNGLPAPGLPQGLPPVVKSPEDIKRLGLKKGDKFLDENGKEWTVK